MLSKLPTIIDGEDFKLTSYPLVSNKHEFTTKLNYFRNLFRSNFGDSRYVTMASTYDYLQDYVALSDDKIMYAISVKNVLVGQYGLKNYGKKRILLDNAIRFAASGPRDLFKSVSIKLIQKLLLIDEHLKIWTVTKDNSLFVKEMHNYGAYRQVERQEYQDLEIPSGLIVSEFVKFH